jgi:hypothetical protein
MHVVGALGLGGGAAPAAVTAPSPTTESVAAGGTPAGKTFAAFTDPDSRIASYSATTTNSVGSATWTGTGLGAYTIGSSADGDSGTLALTALDSSGDPLATAYHSWDIAAAGGATWTDLVDLDYTGLDADTLTGTDTVTKSAVQYGPAVKVDIFGGNGGSITAGSSGIVMTGLNAAGSANLAVDVSSYVDFAAMRTRALRVDIVMTGLAGWTGANDGWEAGLVDSAGNFSTAVTSRSLRADYSSGNQLRKTGRNGVYATWGSAEATPAGSWVVTIVVYAGVQFDVFYALGATPPSDATIDAGGRLFGGNAGAGVAVSFPSALWVSTRSIWRADCTLTRLRIKALE